MNWVKVQNCAIRSASSLWLIAPPPLTNSLTPTSNTNPANIDSSQIWLFNKLWLSQRPVKCLVLIDKILITPHHKKGLEIKILMTLNEVHLSSEFRTSFMVGCTYDRLMLQHFLYQNYNTLFIYMSAKSRLSFHTITPNNRRSSKLFQTNGF